MSVPISVPIARAISQYSNLNHACDTCPFLNIEDRTCSVFPSNHFRSSSPQQLRLYEALLTGLSCLLYQDLMVLVLIYIDKQKADNHLQHATSNKKYQNEQLLP